MEQAAKYVLPLFSTWNGLESVTNPIARNGWNRHCDILPSGGERSAGFLSTIHFFLASCHPHSILHLSHMLCVETMISHGKVPFWVLRVSKRRSWVKKRLHGYIGTLGVEEFENSRKKVTSSVKQSFQVSFSCSC